MNDITSGIKLIGLHGRAGSGKSTVADFITSTYANHYQLAFADPLKEAAAAAFGISLDNFYEQDLKETINDDWGVSPRSIAQFLGTEMFRNTVGNLVPGFADKFWIHRAWLRITNRYVPEDEGEFVPGDTVVISDVRFQNEYDWIIEKGGTVIYLQRPDFEGAISGIKDHVSEQHINFTFHGRTHTCVNDGTLPELYKKVADILFALKF